jgi:hypothetical protein
MIINSYLFEMDHSSTELESIRLVISVDAFLSFHIFLNKNAPTLLLSGYSPIERILIPPLNRRTVT